MQFLKKLELHGFKSFANRTVIDFLPGITVIVGPNGSGKSNIFDAIRWVLGEQSAKSMRGARMGDVIFNGSASVKATGMAKVQLVLDNSRRHLPIDFDEVSIARHLYRTGESEYLLNRTPCRLKDIVSLLMDTGIGTDSYSVLEQGKVDAIINTKPLERRVLFDEAAGISKYKARKEEALAKLARTDEDLVRLNDIIVEVRRQANSLKRQVQKAERYKRLSARLRALEMELLAGRYLRLRDTAQEVHTQYEELHAEVERLRSLLDSLEAEHEMTREESEQIQQNLETVQSQNFAILNQIAEAQGQIALHEQRLESASQRRQALLTELEALKERATSLEQTRLEVAQELGQHEQVLSSLEVEYQRKKAEHDALRANSEESGARLAELRRRLGDAQREAQACEQNQRLAHAMEAKLRAELESSEADRSLLDQQLEALGMEVEERQSTAEELTQILDALKADAQSTKAKLQELENSLSQRTQELEEIRRSAQVTRSRHTALVELQANFEGYFGGVREVMKQASSGALGGIIGVVSTLIEASGEHELAIEAALGSHTQDIVVEHAEDAKAAVEWLKRSGRGRATFLPLDLIEARETPSRLAEMLRQPGVIGVAADLVRYDPKITNAIRHLLGAVVVCQDLDTAIRLERSGYRARFVTLEGELVTPHGAITGGSVKSQGLLHRTREIRELANQLADWEEREAAVAREVEALREQVAQLRTTAQKLASSITTQEIEAARARKDLEVVQQKFADKQASLTVLEQRRARLEEELALQRRTFDETSERLAALRGEITQLEEELSRCESESSQRQLELAERMREVNELLVKLSMARERLNNLREKHETLKREQTRLVEDETARRRELDTLAQEEEAAHRHLAELRQRVVHLENQKRELEERLTFETSRRETIHLDLHKLGERTQEVRRDLHVAQNRFHEVEIRRAEIDVQLATIETQAREKFGLSVEALLEEVQKARTELVDDAPSACEESASEAHSGNGHEPEPASARAETPENEVRTLRQPEELAQEIATVQEKLQSLGPVHVGAIDEYNELNARYEFLTAQERDLQAAKAQLTEMIRQIDKTTTDIFVEAFTKIRENFAEMFRRLFGGGRADLLLTEENGVLDSGIDIVAQPPGKKPTHISLLSGGEKALTAIALLFAIFMRRPSPVCILDEIDAPLDDKNIERFKELVREFAHETQFVIITHNKQTMALADTLYGVTMEEQGVSRLVSIRFDEFEDSELAREMATA